MHLYPGDILQRLEYEKIRALLVSLCRSALGRELAEAMQPVQDVAWIRHELDCCREMLSMQQQKLYFPIDPIFPIRQELSLLRIANAVLSAEQLGQIRRLLGTTEQVIRFLGSQREQFPTLFNLLNGLSYDPEPVKEIERVIDERGQVRDNASKELLHIRQNLNKRRSELNRLFARILQRLQKDGLLADTEQSFINGRKVVAVQAEYKRQLSGILHGESESGRTAFLEPAETTALNNDIFELEREEEREIYRVLRELTAVLANKAPLLAAYEQILARFDFLLAKARLAAQIEGTVPLVHDKPGINVRAARHPVLLLKNRQNGKPTIPLNLFLRDRRILVISGPNAGGKTVAMKTIALLQLMVQSGLPVPCNENSEFGIFKYIFSDIGDTQSIEYELSTYSAHLRTIKHFVQFAGGSTLFFIDELGTGSDPALGGAFAEAVLEALAAKKAFGIVTTHYLNLKILANKNPMILNGAMSFDEENLMPLYELRLGKPGSSYTFQIAKRSGLPQKLIDRAAELVSREQVQLDFLLNKLEQEQRRLQLREQELAEKDQALAELKRQTEEQAKKLRTQQQQLQVQQQKYQSTQYIREAEKQLRKLLVDWQKAKDKETREVIAEATKKVVGEVPAAGTLPGKKEQKRLEKLYEETGEKVREGSWVFLPSLGRIAQVESVHGQSAWVVAGEMRMKAALNQLRAVRKVDG